MKKKTIIISFVGLVIILAIVVGIKEKNKKKATKAIDVRVEAVQSGEFVEIINAPDEKK